MADNQVIIVKKKAAHGHAHHGGSWKVAYADFVTAMMAFFMVMWIMGLSEDNKNIIQGYFNDPMGFNKSVPRSSSIIDLKMKPNGKSKAAGASRPDHPGNNKSDLEGMEKILKRAVAASNLSQEFKDAVDLMVTEEGLRIEFKEAATPVFFESGSAVLRPEGMRLIRQVGPVLANKGCKMIIEGHTDSVGFGSAGNYTNWELSNDRAGAMRRALKDSGVTYPQFKSVTGYAETKPLYPNSKDPRNRRVSILIPYEDSSMALGGGDKEPKQTFIKGINIKPEIQAPK